MEKRALIAFVLSMVVFVGWSFIFSPEKKPVQPTDQPTQETVKTTGQESTAPEKIEQDPTVAPPATAEVQDDSAKKISVKDAKEILVKTNLYTAVFSESGGRLKSLKLAKHRETIDPQSQGKELVILQNPSDLPLGLDFKNGNGPNLQSSQFTADKSELILGPGEDSGELTFKYTDTNGLVVERKYSFQNDSYLIGQDVQLLNMSENSIDDNLVMHLASKPLSKKDRYAGFGAYIDGSLEQIKPKKLKEDIEELKNKNFVLSWAGYMDQYFMAAVLPKDQERTRLDATVYGEKGVSIDFICPPLEMPPDTQKSYHFDLYYGPKDFNVMKSMDNDLKEAIDLGWMTVLSKPILIFMTWLHKYVKNYGIVIIVITVIIKIIFWPLTAKSYKSMKNMQKLQPKIMALREKYKDDRQKMNQEMMGLYRTYKVNPMGGCLPMVIQIPVFIALYRLLDYSLELRHAPFALWITDLSAPDRLLHFDFKIPLMDAPTGIPVLTLLMGASMLIQQKMTPTPGDPMQARMMMLLPVFFTFIFINFPAGLVLYWLTNNILSVAQQTIINKRKS